MGNVILYIVAAVACGVQVYEGVARKLWWEPPGPLPGCLVGIITMVLGAAWAAAGSASSAWMVFLGSILCWVFYVPGLSNQFNSIWRLLAEGRLSASSLDIFLPLLPPILLLIATIRSLLIGPMGRRSA